MGSVKLKKPDNAKERNLVKGALRRLFGRSEIRRNVIEKAIIKGYSDPKRKAVKFWVKCETCGKMEAKSNVQIDHREPLIPIDSSLEEMTWDQVVDRLWCDEDNLAIICKPCHRSKSSAEMKERKRLKKLRGMK